MNAQQSMQRWLLVVLTALLVGLIVMFLTPTVAFRITYAMKAAEFQAKAQVARGQLKDLNDTSEAFRLVVDAVSPAVVHIRAIRQYGRTGQDGGFPFRGFGSQPYVQQSVGSGVIVDPAGYILTNYHVVKDAEIIEVRLADGRSVRSPKERMMVGSGDPPTDLAVLKIDANDLVAAPWGDSEQLSTGDWVLAIGNPFGLDRTVTAGIVSAKGRFHIVENVDYQQFIQTDAAINPGNSGGPLVNLKGEIVGINTAILGQNNVGIGFAIPSSIAQVVFDRLVKNGKIVRGWLGIELLDLDADLASRFGLDQPKGVLVTRVLKGDPADKAGVEVGDVILSFDGRRVKDANDLRNRVATTEVGRTVTLGLARNGEDLDLSVEIGLLQERVPLGFSVGELPREYVERGYRGVMVTEVTPRSRVGQQGLLAGDFIVEVARQPIESVTDFQRAIAGANPSNRKVVLVQRRGASPFIITVP